MRQDISKIKVVALSGEEFQRCDRMNNIIATVVDPATKDFNYVEFFPWDFNDSEFSDFVLTYPLMAERRVAVLRKFDTSFSQKETGVRKETGFPADKKKKICELLKDIPSTTLVIIEGDKVTLSPKPDPASVVTEEFKRVYERDVMRWISRRFEMRGKKAANEGIHLMINNIGLGLRELDNEIEKICVAFPDKNSLSCEDVQQIVGPLRRDNVWNLCNAVGLGNLKKASEILEVLLEADNKASSYIWAIGNHIIKLMRFNEMLAGGVPEHKAVEAFSAKFLWEINKMGEQAKNLTPSETRRIINALVRSDSLLKKHGVDNILFLELLLPFILPGALRKKRA